MTNEAYLPFFVGLTLAELLGLLLLVWLGFRLFGGTVRARNWCFLVLSYPGIFSMGGGTVGFAVPLPLLLGAPVWLLTWSRSPTSGVGWAVWRPAPLLSTVADLGAPWLRLELGMLVVWLLFVALLLGWSRVARSERRPG